MFEYEGDETVDVEATCLARSWKLELTAICLVTWLLQYKLGMWLELIWRSLKRET